VIDKWRPRRGEFKISRLKALLFDRTAEKERHVDSADNISTPEEDIKTRAYAIWEQEGRPEGQHLDHWTRAAQEFDGSPAPAEAPQPAPKRNGSGKI
jgi:Protein of unknown function (DUF2934)